MAALLGAVQGGASTIMRGFGQSPPAVGTFSMSGDVVELLDELELGAATLIGVSLGGAVAMETTIARP